MGYLCIFAGDEREAEIYCSVSDCGAGGSVCLSVLPIVIIVLIVAAILKVGLPNNGKQKE